jgi:hypothetical protein
MLQQVSQYCASYFDQHQADWQRGRAPGLFGGWRSGLAVDHSIEPLMHAPEIRARVRQLPETADAAIDWSLERLGVAPEDAVEFLQVCVLRINGWASWCAYLGWEAALAGSTDTHLRELLAIRVSWEALLHEGPHRAGPTGSPWHEQWAQARRQEPSPSPAWDLIWQRAHEISYQDRIVDLLEKGRGDLPREAGESRATSQLVFCIDVRSERFRRALESSDPMIETRGFAGFFGLPIRYTPLGIRESRPHLPGLLAPSIDVTESTGNPLDDGAIARRRDRRLKAKGSRLPFLRSPSGAFALVETLGIGYVGAILRRHYCNDSDSAGSRGSASESPRALRPHLRVDDGDPIGRKADLVASTLRGMSLTSGFARLLVLVGHGSQTANNPQAAGLDCGACGGQTGEVNARILAGLLNERLVRAALARRGIDIPEDTIAIAALHNTTTDEVRLFDLADLPDSHAPDLALLQRSLLSAADSTRAERAPSLGLAAFVARPEALLRQVRRRASDWAETRPEWGLANNAAFIVAPRARTLGLDLAGRCFLHDYSCSDDPDGKVLELIMTAPMVVAHWINLQYYASTVDPGHFGSGNKVLHNVVCGRIGVFEGNTGDLRIGLARQSVHDGERWMHAPLRLSVFIDAPRDRIEGIIARYKVVAQLVGNHWLYLFRFGDGCIEQFHEGGWESWRSGGSPL